MAWRDTLQGLRDDLAEMRAQRQRESQAEEEEQQAQRVELRRIAESMGLAGLLEEMNSVLLNGQGKVENISSWEEEFEEEENDSMLMLDGLEDLDESDYISSMLTWDEDGEREIAVDLAFGEQGIALMVNEVDIRPEQDALEQALVSAFREQLEL